MKKAFPRYPQKRNLLKLRSKNVVNATVKSVISKQAIYHDSNPTIDINRPRHISYKSVEIKREDKPMDTNFPLMHSLRCTELLTLITLLVRGQITTISGIIADTDSSFHSPVTLTS